jgi:large repetitive protein
VDDPDDGAPDPAGPQKTVSGDILAGDTDVDGPGPLVVTAETKATSDGGSVTIESDGDFTFHPKAGTSCTDASDQFDYTVSDQASPTAGTDTGTVTVAIADCAWYVDDSAPAGGDGRSGAPYASLAPLMGGSDPDGTGDYVFLYDGSYTGGFTLENSQRLFTEKHGLSVPDGGAGNVTLEAADGSGSDLQGGLVLGSGNSVQGLNLGTTGSSTVFALSGTSVGTTSVNNLTAGNLNNPAGGAVNIDGTGNTLTVAFGSLTSTGASGNAIRLVNSSGSFSAGSGGTISAAGTTDVTLNGGGIDFTLGSTLADDTGQLVLIQNKTGGTNDFNGALTDSPFDNNGGGISLQSNTGTTRFDGGVKLSTGPNPGIVATNGGTVAIPDPDGAGAQTNFVDATTGAALNLAFTTIASDDLVFERLKSNGAANGVLLNTTGSSGGLTVTGDGTAGSGGTIQNSTAAGIDLNTVGGGVDLTRMNITGGGNDGIRATSVTGFSLANSTVTSNGNAVGERGLDFSNVRGTAAITSSTISGSAEDNVRWENDGGSVGLTMTGSTISNNSATTGADGLLFRGGGNATMTALITGNTFLHNRDDGFQLANSTPSTAQMNATFSNNTVTQGVNNVPNNAAVSISGGSSADTKVKMDNNDLSGSLGSALILNPGPDSTAAASYDAIITNNDIGTATAGSGSENGIGIWGRSAGNGVNRFEIRNNTIQHFQQQGMYLYGNEGTGQQTDYTVTGNTISNPDDNVHFRVLLEAGSTSGDSTDVCVDFGGAGALANTVASGATSADIGIGRDFAGSVLTLRDYAGEPASLATYFNSRNTGSPGALTAILSNLYPAGSPAACALPATPATP